MSNAPKPGACSGDASPLLCPKCQYRWGTTPGALCTHCEAGQRSSEARPDVCGHCRYAAESNGVYVCSVHGLPKEACTYCKGTGWYREGTGIRNCPKGCSLPQRTEPALPLCFHAAKGVRCTRYLEGAEGESRQIIEWLDDCIAYQAKTAAHDWDRAKLEANQDIRADLVSGAWRGKKQSASTDDSLRAYDLKDTVTWLTEIAEDEGFTATPEQREAARTILAIMPEESKR